MASLRGMVVSLTWCLFASVAVQAETPSRIRPRASLTKRDAAAAPNPTICGDIINVVNTKGSRLFYASDAYDCLMSVPFNAAVALRFIDYYNTTIQFQSTLAYLKKPPTGYQQPAVDVFAQIQAIRKNVTTGVYKNQYLFEADFQYLVYQMHDSHVDLSAGILSTFSFASPFNLVTASLDGKQEPKVYLRADVLKRQQGVKFQISPIAKINDKDAVAYLTKIAAQNSVGMLEPHADWNTIMSTPSLAIQGLPNIFSGEITFYPGTEEHSDELNFQFANGSKLETYWTAHYTEPYYTGPLSTGGDYYNYFVLGHRPASYDETDLPPAFQRGGRGPAEIPDPGPWVPWNSSAGAYPRKPDVLQANLAESGGGVVTGYFLKDISTGVLSIPTFQQTGWDIGNFTLTTAKFIEQAQVAKLSRVVIDLQDNYGGLAMIASVLFRQFFPSAEAPYAGSRRRSHPKANVLGQTWTKYWNGLPEEHEDWDELMGNPWVITPLLNAETNKTFKSWAEYYGPKKYNGDDFSLVERYDMSNKEWSAANFAGWYATEYTDEATKPPPAAAWKAKDIVILTNGICGSTCSIFVEMMTTVGVRTVVVGGAPRKGPMQTAAGTRGAAFYEAGRLDYDIDGALEILAEGGHLSLLDNRDTGMMLHHAGFSLRHQVRPNDHVPLQFKYLPADCRLYYTLSNAWNMSALWRDAARASFIDPSMCVEGSTRGGSAGTGSGATNSSASSIPKQAIAIRPALNFDIDYSPDGTNDAPEPLQAGKGGPSKNITMTPCEVGVTSCKTKGLVCEDVSFRCPNKKIITKGFCVPLCNTHNTYCPSSTNGGSLVCGNFLAPSETGNTVGFGANQLRPALSNEKPIMPGNCMPLKGNKALGCK